MLYKTAILISDILYDMYVEYHSIMNMITLKIYVCITSKRFLYSIFIDEIFFY